LEQIHLKRFASLVDSNPAALATKKNTLTALLHDMVSLDWGGLPVPNSNVLKKRFLRNI
jgi:hypothetical protein